ncbi:unnamed protein product [Schistocephalus solidus]|uniref:Ovule protein n=1 Tax=Schistocephalus solidus TaxID=70667 RepID=A0A183TNG8_SCHSO|nr:unnamed protein product [Schistocephalus solidus]
MSMYLSLFGTKRLYREIRAIKHRVLIVVWVNNCTLHDMHLLLAIMYCVLVDTNKRMQIMACYSLHQEFSPNWKSCETKVEPAAMRRSANKVVADERFSTVLIES